MGAPVRKIQGDGPVQVLARRLQVLREGSKLKLDDLVKISGMSRTALSDATNGTDVPKWPLVEAYVRGCGGDPDDYRASWTEAMDQVEQVTMLDRAARRLDVVQGREALRAQLRYLAGPPPSPVGCSTAQDFVECLRAVKTWATPISVRELAAATNLPASTVQDVFRVRGDLKETQLPKLEHVIPVLQACGIKDEIVLREWVFTWRRIRVVEAEVLRGRGRAHLRVAK